MFQKTRKTDSSWEMMVAMAAPATPMRSPPTRSRSSAMLVQLAATRYRKGSRELPTARSTPEATL